MVFLAMTDTTVGFLCHDASVINLLKSSPLDKKLLKELSSFSQLMVRIPRRYRSFVRHARRATFIVSGEAFRVVCSDDLHLRFLKLHGSLYSSSANTSGKKFDLEFALKSADIIVGDSRGFIDSSPSRIYRLSHTRIKRLR